MKTLNCLIAGLSVLGTCLFASARDAIVCDYAFSTHIQGATCDGTHLFVVAKNEILKADLTGATVKALNTSSDHHGDPTLVNGKLYVPVNRGEFSELGKATCYVEVYDAATLTLEKTYGPFYEPIYGAGGMTYRNGSFYIVGGLPDDGTENLIFEYVEEDGRFRFVRRHTLPIYTGKGIQTTTVIDDRFWFGVDTPYSGGAALNPIGTLVCSTDFADYHRTDFQGPWGIVRVGDDIGYIPYSSSTCTVKFDYDFTKPYTVGYIAGRADSETVSANPLDVNELILASGSSRTGTVIVSTNLTVRGTSKVGTFAGGFGTLTLKGGALSLAASSGGTCLTVGVNGAVARAGELSGWGAVSATAATTSLAVYDRLVADGFGEQRDLDLSALTGVVEPAAPSAAVAPGWYARNGGRLLLPVRSAAVTSSKLQNAVTSSLTGLRVALCAPDRADIPAAPELDWLTVWRVGSSSSFTTASLSFVHAFSAAETVKTVSLYRHDGTSWTKLRDLTAAELSSGSFSVSSVAKTADTTWNLGFFALAVPRGTVFYGNKSVDLAAATGWYTDPARTVASGVAPCASSDPLLPNVYLMNNDVAKTSTKADPVSFAGDIFQLGDADTAATLYTMNGTFSFPSFLFYGGELTLNNNGTVVLNGSYRFAESANTISLGAKSVSTKSRNLTLSGTFAAPAGVTVHCSSAYGATRTKNTTFLLSGDFSGFAGSLRFETPANATAEYPIEIELTAPSALGDEAFPRADALVLTDLCVLRPAADVSFSRTRGIRLELADGETATVDVPTGTATLAAPVSGAATGSFVKTGVGTLVLDGSYAAADITVSAGTLAFGADVFFPRATQVTVSPGAAVTGTVPRNVTVFKVGQLTWIGEGADDRFTTPENWEGGAVPSLAANEGPLAVAGGLAAVVDTPAQFPSVSFSGYAFSFSGSERLTLTGSAHEFQESGSYAFDAPLTLTGTQNWTLPTDTAVSFGGSVTATGPVAFASPLSASVTLTGDNTALTGALSFTNIHLRLSGTAPLGPGSTKVSLGYSSGDEFGEGDADNAVVTALAPGLSLARPLAVAPSAKTTARRYVYRAQAGSTNTLASFDFYSSLGGTTKYLLTFEAGSRTRFDTLCGKSANSIQLAGAGEVEFDGWTLGGSLKTGRLETSGDGLLVRVAGPFDRNNGMELAAGDTLRLAVADAMPVAKAASAAGTTVVIDGTLDLAGNDQTILNLSGAGRVVSSAGTATLALTNGTGAALMSALSFATNVSVSILSDAFTFTGASDSDGVLTLGGTAALAFNGSGSWKGGALDLVGDASTVAPATDGSSYVKELWLNGTKLADGLYGAGSAAAVAAGVSARFTGTGLLQVGGTPPGPGPEPEPEKDTGTINLKTDRTISYEDVTATPSLLVTNYTSASGATLTLDATSAFTLSGSLSGNLALVKAGGNKLTLSCTTNTYSGGTSLQKDAICITAGTSVPGSGALGTGKVTIQTAKSSSNGQLYIQGVTGDATIPNDLHFLGTASTDYGHQTSQGNVYLAAGGDVSVTLSGTVTAAGGCGFSLATSRIGGNLTLAGDVNAPGATIYPTAYKGSTISFNGPVTAGVVDCGYYGDNHYGTVQFGSGSTHTLGELRVGHQNVKLNGTLADGCVLSWPLADEKTTLAGCSILTLGANVTADRLTSATLTTAQAARNTFAITGSGRTLTFKPSAALAETYVAVSGSVSVALQALDKTYVQAFLARKSVTSGKLNVQKGVLRLGTGASFPNVTDITVGKDGTFDLASTAANPVSAAATLRLTTGATLKVAAGVTLTVDKLFVDGSAAAASAVTVTGGGTLVVKTAPAPVETVVTIPSGCLTTNDLSFVTAPSKLLIGYGTLRYVGAATTIPGLTFDPTVSYRASVISNHTDLVLGSLVNKDATKGALIKYGQGTLTLGGTDKVTLKGYGPRNGNTKTKVLVDGNSQDSNFATLTVNEGELAIGATGDAANAPTIELHGLASGSGWIAGISAGGTDLRDDATISFRNGVVTNAGNVFAGFYYPATSGAIGATKTVTLRWCGGRTYGINLYGRYIESQASYVYGRSDLLVEAGEAVFSGDAYLCHSKGTTGENNRARLLVSGGRLAVAGNVFVSAPKSYAGADVLIALSGGEFSVGGTFDLLSNTSTASSTYKSQRVSLVLSPGGLLRYGALIRSGNGTYCNETGVLFGDGGVLMPHNAVTNLSTLAHVYASTNGLVVSTADLDAADVYEIAQAIESDPALVKATRVDGGLVKKGTGTLKLAAANTFTGPVRVEAGTLLLATAGAVNATNDLYLTTGAALQIPSGVSITVNRAYVNGVQVAATAVPVTGGGTLVVTDEPASAEPLVIASGCVTTNDLSFVTDASRLVIGYGTLRYVGAATAIPGLTFDPTVIYRASVISNAADVTLGPIVNNDVTKGALLKYGAGTLTLGGTETLTLKGFAGKDVNTKTKVLVNGDSQDSNLTTLTANEGELAIGVVGDAANAPFLTLHGQTASLYVGGVAAGGTDMRGNATVSFDNGVVTNASNFYAGYFYPHTAATTADKVMTLRWRGGRTYGVGLYGKLSNDSANAAKGRAEILMEAGETVFSGDGHLSHSKGGSGAASAVLLRVSGGRMAFGGNLYGSRLTTTRGADVDIDLRGGELVVGGTVDLGSVTTYNSGWVKQSVQLGLHPGAVLRYGALTRTCSASYTAIGVLFGDGGVLMPHNAVTNLSTLAHVYASTNGLVVSTADLDAADVYEIAQAIESDPALVKATRVDGGLVKKGAGTLKLAAANTFTGPVRVEAGTLLLATAGAVNATNDLYLTTGAALQIPSGVSITVNRAYVDGVQVAAAAVPVTGGGTLVVTDEPVSADVYFDSSAAAGGTGTQARPFKTPVDFDFSRLAAGGRAYFRRGSVFRGPVTVRGVCGEAGNPVVLCAYGTGARPVFEGDNAIDTNVLTLADCDYLTVTDFEIRDTVGTAATNRCGVALFVSESESTDVRVSHEIVLTNLYIHTIRGLTAGDNASADLKRTGGIQVWSSASSRFDGLEIVGNTITNVDSTGIAIWRMPVIGGTPIPSPWNSATEFARTAHTNVRIAFNDVSDIGKNAIVVRNLKGGVVERNVVHDTSVRTLREDYVVGGNAIFTSYVDGTVIQYNEGYRNCANASDGAFLDADLHSKDTVWQYNYSHDNRFGLFICCTYKKDNPIVRGNLSVNDQGAYHGILSLNYVCTNLLFYNNTIITGPTTTNVFDIFSNATGHYYRVFNNVICNRSPYARICCPVAEDRANGEWKNNLVFNAPGAQIVSTGAYDPRTVYPDAVISTADPKFATAPADTLAGRCGWSAVEVAIPADDSPVFGLGEPVDLETDILGRIWRQTLGCVAQLPEGSSWTSLKSGNWSVGSNWASGTAPDSANAHVGLEALGAGADDPLIVTVDKNVAAAEVAVRSAAYGLAGTHVLTLGTAEESGVMSVSGTAGELTVGVPVCAAGGLRLNDFASAAEVAAAGRVNWQATSLTGGPLVLGAGVTDFSSAAALAFVSANDQLVLGRGTARFACGSVSLAGFTLGYEGMNGLSVAADETLTVASVATAGRGYNGLYKYGPGTLKFGGTGTSTIGGGQFSAFVAATEATAGVSPNGNAPTNGLMSVEIADGAVVLGTLDDAANAPIVKVANGMAVGCKNGPLGVEPTSGSLIINNGSFEVLKGTTYLGYYAGRTNDVGTAAPSITVNGGTLKMGGDFRVNYAANTSRIKCTPTFTINGGTVETLGTVGTGDCTIGKNYPIVFAMNGGVWHIYGNFYSSSRGSSSPLTFYGDGGKLTVDKSFDPNYAQTQGGDYNEFFFRTNFTLRTAKIVPTKRNDRSRITFAKATWEVPTGTGCLEGVGTCALAKGGVTIDLDEVYPFTFNQKLKGDGFVYVSGLGEVQFGAEMTNTVATVMTGRIQFDRGISAVLNGYTAGAKFTFLSGSTLKAEGDAAAHTVELRADSCLNLSAGTTLAVSVNLKADASGIGVVAPGYGTYTQLLYKASSSSSVDPAAFVKAAGSSAKLDKVEIVDVDATWKGVAMTFSKIQTFDVAQDVGDFVLDPGVRFKLDAGFAADTFLFPAVETIFDLNGTARLVVREALSVAAGGSVVLDPTLGLSRNPKARRMPVLKVAGLTDALLAKFRVADRYAARWSIVVDGEYVWLEKADGTVVALDGTAVEPEPETDVYLLIGQSNMAGRGLLANEGDVVSSNRILKMNAAHAWVAGTEPFHYDKPDVVGVGPGGSFAQAMADANRRATIALVPAAYGGTSLTQWQPGAAIIEGLSEGYTNANLYSNAVYRTREALASLPNARLCGILWHQGESDSGNQGAANAYFARYTNLIVRLRADLGCGDVPFVAGELSEFSASAFKGTVNKTLHATTNVLANVGVATSEGLTANSDNIHFNTESQRKFGFRYAAKMKEIQKNETNR